MHVQMAWRNIWRNPRRTAVIMIAIIIGVWSMIFLGALVEGMLVTMVENGIATLVGDIQIHAKGYRNDPVVDNSMTQPDEVIDKLDELLPDNAKWVSRIRVDAVASNARHSTGLTMVGIDPAAESQVSFIGPKAIIEGEYLSPDDEYGIVVGKALVDKLETQLGYKLVLMSQDTEGEIASRAFRIVGIYRTELQSTEKQFAFVTRSVASEMLGLENSLSEICISLDDHYTADDVADTLRPALPDTYEVLTWRQLSPILDAYIELNGIWTFIWYLVVFIAMGFGIVNTTLMAVFERMREFGLMKALGMRPMWIVRGVLTESLFLLIMGIAIGNGLGFLSTWALSGTGIDLSSLAAGVEFSGMPRVIYPVIAGNNVIVADLVVLVLGVVVSLYPAIKAAKFTPVEALSKV